MRKFLIAGALLVAVASTSFAIELPLGHVRMKFDDLTTLYVPEGVNGQTWQPLPADTIPDASLVGVAQLRSIFRVTTMGKAAPGGHISPDGEWSPSSTEELAGTITNLVVANVVHNTVDRNNDGTDDTLYVTVEYAPMAGTPLTDVDSPANPVSAPSAPASGGRMTIYRDESPDYPNSPNPGDWFESAYDADPTGTKRLEFPGVGRYDAAGVEEPDHVRVFLDGTLVDLRHFGENVTAGTVMLQDLEYDIDPDGNVLGLRFGSTKAMVNSIRTGEETFGPNSDVMEYTRLSLDGLIIEDWAGKEFANSEPFGDAHLYANLQWGQDYGGWMFLSNDPFDYARGPIPEPATVVLLGGALLGLARRRRKRA